MQPLEIQITGKADSALAAAQEIIRAHEKILAQTKLAGGETAALEARLASLRAEAARQWNAEFVKGTQAVIADSKTASAEVERLKGLLNSVQQAPKPAFTPAAPLTDPLSIAFAEGMERSTQETLLNDKAIDDWAKSMGAGAKAADTATIGIKDLAGGSRIATTIMQALSRASNGGADAVLGIGSASKAAAGALLSNLGPAGAVGIIAGVVGGLILLIQKISSASESQFGGVGENAKSAQDAIDETTAAAKRLAETSLAGIIDETGALKTANDEVLKSMQGELEAQNKLLQAQAAVARTRIVNDLATGKITNVEAERQRSSIQLGLDLVAANDPAERAAIELQGTTDAAAAANSEYKKIAESARFADRAHTDYALALIEGRAALEDLSRERAAAGREAEQRAVSGQTPGLTAADARIRAESTFDPQIQKLENDISAFQLSIKEATERAKAFALEEEASRKRLSVARDAETAARNRLAKAAANEDAIVALKREEAAAAAATAERAAAEADAAKATRLAAAARASAERALGEQLAAAARDIDPKLVSEATAKAAAELEKVGEQIGQAGADPARLAAAQAALKTVFDAATAAGSPVAKHLADLGHAIIARRIQLELETFEAVNAERRKAGAPAAALPPPAAVPARDLTRTGVIEVGGKPFVPPTVEPTTIVTPKEIEQRRAAAAAAAPDLSRGGEAALREPSRGGEDALRDQSASDLSAAAEALTAAASALTAAADTTVPGEPRARGGPVTKGKRHLVGEQGPELFVPATDGTIIPADKTPTFAPSNVNPAGHTIAPSNVNPAGHTIAPSNSNPPDELAPDGIIRSNAQAQQRAKEQSAAFNADPANAPKGPTPPTPANPPKSGMSNAEWKQFARSNPEAAQRKIDAAQSGVDPSSNEAVAARDAARDAAPAPPSAPPAPVFPTAEIVAGFSAAMTGALASVGLQFTSALASTAREQRAQSAAIIASNDRIAALLDEQINQTARERVA